MRQFLRRSLLLIALLTVVGAAGCKYTGNDSDRSESDQDQSDEEVSEAEEDDGAADDDDQMLASEAIDGLGGGTGEQKNLLARAKQAFLKNDLEAAEAHFEQLADTEPVSGPQVSGIIALAQIYNETDRAEEAVELYEGLSEEVEEMAEVQLVIARSLAEQDQIVAAIEAYEKLLDTKPDFVFALVELANLYAEQGDREEAAETLFEYEKRVYGLAEKLEDPQTPDQERIYVLDVFSLANDDRATKAVVEALSAESPHVRQKAARVVGQTAAVEAKEPLEEVAEGDPDERVRSAATEALQELEELEVEAKDDQIGPKFVREKHELPEGEPGEDR